jgi:hypothetical protein
MYPLKICHLATPTRVGNTHFFCLKISQISEKKFPNSKLPLKLATLLA